MKARTSRAPRGSHQTAACAAAGTPPRHARPAPPPTMTDEARFSAEPFQWRRFGRPRVRPELTAARSSSRCSLQSRGMGHSDLIQRCPPLPVALITTVAATITTPNPHDRRDGGAIPQVTAWEAKGYIWGVSCSAGDRRLARSLLMLSESDFEGRPPSAAAARRHRPPPPSAATRSRTLFLQPAPCQTLRRSGHTTPFAQRSSSGVTSRPALPT